MTEVVELSATDFNSVIKQSNRPVVIKFWIRSCTFCQKFKPIYEQLPAIFENKVNFFQMNMFLTLDNLHLAEGLGVEDTPTLKLFCKGKEIGELVGYKALDVIKKEIEAILQKQDCYR
jgi:thioredoxin-like negative regulator of GroEL